MKVSVITAVLNGAKTIEDCIKSVAGQTYPDIEHIIIDGGSTDGTLDIIKKYNDKIAKVLSEPDNGIYDAMNKGIKMADGDIIGILNSDDLYADESIIQTVVDTVKESNTDACYGDLVYVDKNNTDKIIRYWESPVFIKKRFKRNVGLVPPHPTFFVKRRVYEKYGLFNVDFKFSADHELMIRFLFRYGINAIYIPKVLVKMRIGGSSNRSLPNIVKANIECYRAWKANNLKINPLAYILMKPAPKILQYTLFKKFYKC